MSSVPESLFDIPLFPAGAGVAIPEIETVESTRSHQEPRGMFLSIIKYYGHAYVVLNHTPGHTVHLFYLFDDIFICFFQC